MGLTDVILEVSNPRQPRRRAAVKFLVDSGAAYTVLPKQAWKKLGLQADEQLELTLGDGTSVTRSISEARFVFRGRARTSPVIMGEEGDVALLGVVTLETLGLVLNPLRRELVPMRMILA